MIRVKLSGRLQVTMDSLQLASADYTAMRPDQLLDAMAHTLQAAATAAANVAHEPFNTRDCLRVSLTVDPTSEGLVDRSFHG